MEVIVDVKKIIKFFDVVNDYSKTHSTSVVCCRRRRLGCCVF